MEKESDRMLTKRLLPAIFGLALVLRLPIFVLDLFHPTRFFTPDSQGYISSALNFHRAYFEPNSYFFRLGLIRTPGYPGSDTRGVFRRRTTGLGDHPCSGRHRYGDSRSRLRAG